MLRPCSICGKTFLINAPPHKYCSKECKKLARSNRIICKDYMRLWDEKEVQYLKLNYNNMRTKELAQNLNRNTCSCLLKANKLNLKKTKEYYKKFPNKSSNKGYISKGYVRKSKNGTKIDEHRQVWINAHGRIPHDSVIHHINGVKSDNRIKNLKLMKKWEHISLHNRKLNYKKIIDGRNMGKTMRELANESNTSTGRIHDILSRANLAGHKTKKAKQKYEDIIKNRGDIY